MQIIDELETVKRGPYGGGVGHVSFTGSMDMALALRTMVIPTQRDDTLYCYGEGERAARREWVVHVQVRGGGAFISAGVSRLLCRRVRASWQTLCLRRSMRKR